MWWLTFNGAARARSLSACNLCCCCCVLIEYEHTRATCVCMQCDGNVSKTSARASIRITLTHDNNEYTTTITNITRRRQWTNTWKWLRATATRHRKYYKMQPSSSSSLLLPSTLWQTPCWCRPDLNSRALCGCRCCVYVLSITSSAGTRYDKYTTQHYCIRIHVARTTLTAPLHT